jgi:hypothetical protein
MYLSFLYLLTSSSLEGEAEHLGTPATMLLPTDYARSTGQGDGVPGAVSHARPADDACHTNMILAKKKSAACGGRFYRSRLPVVAVSAQQKVNKHE